MGSGTTRYGGTEDRCYFCKWQQGYHGQAAATWHRGRSAVHGRCWRWHTVLRSLRVALCLCDRCTKRFALALLVHRPTLNGCYCLPAGRGKYCDAVQHGPPVSWSARVLPSGASDALGGILKVVLLLEDAERSEPRSPRAAPLVRTGTARDVVDFVTKATEAGQSDKAMPSGTCIKSKAPGLASGCITAVFRATQ